MSSISCQIRLAEPEDAALVHEFILAIAEYEKLADEVTSTPDDIRRALAAQPPMAEVFLAFFEGHAVGFALFFPNFSTFTGHPGLHLEDIFVSEDFRGRGIGGALFLEVVKLAHARGCARVDWVALHDNDPALSFYERLGARMLGGWRLLRLERGQIESLAVGSP